MESMRVKEVVFGFLGVRCVWWTEVQKWLEVGARGIDVSGGKSFFEMDRSGTPLVHLESREEPRKTRMTRKGEEGRGQISHRGTETRREWGQGMNRRKRRERR